MFYYVCTKKEQSKAKKNVYRCVMQGPVTATVTVIDNSVIATCRMHGWMYGCITLQIFFVEKF